MTLKNFLIWLRKVSAKNKISMKIFARHNLIQLMKNNIRYLLQLESNDLDSMSHFTVILTSTYYFIKLAPSHLVRL